MANIYPDKGYFEVATDEQQLEELKERWSGRHDAYNKNTVTCRTCKGKGYTRATRTTIKRIDGKLRTTEMGSGCPVCYGVGKLSSNT